MQLFEWKPEYSVSVSRFDREHKELFALAEDLCQAMREGKGRGSLQMTLGALTACCKQHFASEEELLARYGYPELKHHRFEHTQLVLKLLDFAQKVSSSDTPAALELVEFLRRWIPNHVLQTDGRYGNFLNLLGVY